MTERVAYDEFSYFHENATEFGLPYDGPPAVRRRSVALPDGRHLSALVWGDGPAELVLLHGGAQNAHTWDTVAMALGRPLVAIDLRVLREAGLVQVRREAQRRVYALDPGPLNELDVWLAPYRRLWNEHLHALGRHLDATTEED